MIVFLCKVPAGQDVDIIHKSQFGHLVYAPYAVLHQISVEKQEEDERYRGALQYASKHLVGRALPSTQY